MSAHNPDSSTSYLEEEKIWNVLCLYTVPHSNNQFIETNTVKAKTIFDALRIADDNYNKKMEEIVYKDPEQHLVIHRWDSYQIVSINLIR